MKNKILNRLDAYSEFLTGETKNTPLLWRVLVRKPGTPIQLHEFEAFNEEGALQFATNNTGFSNWKKVPEKLLYIAVESGTVVALYGKYTEQDDEFERFLHNYV